MSDYKVSIIIPIHNCAQYLPQCLQSVLQQTMSDIEVILVNDASSDDSQSIIDDHAARDSRIVVIEFERNSGVSAARNTGIERAVGEYVIFLDGDDYWGNETMLQQLYDTAKREQTDFVSFGFCRVDDAGNKSGFMLESQGPVDLRQQKDWLVSYNIWAKLISRKLLLDNAIRFEATWGEDALFSITLFCFASRMFIVEQAFYCYRNNPQGESKIRWRSEKLFGTVRWFAMAITVIRDSGLIEHYPEVLQSIIIERLKMLFTRLGPMALSVLSENEQRQYFALWSQCFRHIDMSFFESRFRADLDHDLQRQLLKLLSTVDNDNTGDTLREFFTSDSYRQRLDRKQQSVTLSRAQANQLGTEMLKIERERIRCDLGNGKLVTLSKDDAHKLARQLIANQKASITLNFN